MKLTATLRIGLLTCLFLVLNTNYNHVYADNRPQWINQGEETLNKHRSDQSYYFKIVYSSGSDLAGLRVNRMNELSEYVGRSNQVNGMSLSELESDVRNGTPNEHESFRMVFRNQFSSETFYAVLVDDYSEQVKLAAGGYEYRLYSLFAVSASSSKPINDRFEVSRSYGAGPVFLSIIPGVGQLVKGQKVKGACMLSGAALGAAAIVLCENRRVFNQNRIVEQPKFARTYSQRSDNWATGRNIAIGCTAALMVWSIIDAAVAPGAEHIVVRPFKSLSMRPAAIATPDALGIGASLALSF